MRKILILYATAGIGHKKAALAVKAALDEIAPKDTEVTIADALDYTNAFFKWSYLQAYLFMVNKLPTFWGIAYYLTDNYFVNLLVCYLRRLNNWMNSFVLVKYLQASKPDVVISTHFFASEVIGELIKNGGLNSRLITVVTDYRLHSWWLAPRTDTYVVAGNDARDDLIRWKVDPSIIKVYGIPVEPAFTKGIDKAAVAQKAGFVRDLFTILVIGGGFGVGPIEDIAKAVGRLSKKAQLAVICGHNEELVSKIEALRPGMKNITLKVMGFVNNVHEYMGIADVLISKSGGITVSEALARELPMIVIAPIIGQETRNCGFIVKSGAAIKLSRVSQLDGTLEGLAANPEKMKRLKDAIHAIKKPMACYDVARLALGEKQNM
jgi:processive 1,2-diacylglycerol beta-glucosyltransferase